MEEKKVTEKKKKEDAMTREDFAVLWKTIHLKITDTYLRCTTRNTLGKWFNYWHTGKFQRIHR